MPLSAPAPLSEAHHLGDFDCSSPALTKWLIERARKNHAEGATRCFVVCDGPNVVGYYALAAGSAERDSAPGALRRNMPNPIPVFVLGRLAVHRKMVNRGIGSGMLKDAIQRCVRTAQEIGARALLCHAVDQAAKDFYLHNGFVESPTDALMVMLPLARLLAE